MPVGSPSASGGVEEDLWFHGNIGREEAENLLLREGDEGSFLVRESTSSVGDYAITVLSAGTAHHVQIKRHSEDAFFSLEGSKVFHGLDALIKEHQKLTGDRGDCTLLRKPITKSPPPPECRLHGRTNLLHRATKEGSLEIVLGMVRCGYRSLDAKNEEGQTAAHLAAMQGLNEILTILIQAGINVNAKDSNNYTPLHYTCINNHPKTTHILLVEGIANPQLRRSDNGWVPMHEAASRGHLECVKALYRNNAPLRPRTLDNKLPIHLAIQHKLDEVVTFFDSVRAKRPLSNREDWFHGFLDRTRALHLLQRSQNSSNDDPSKCHYLIRRHSKEENVYVLTVLYQGRPYNFRIGREVNFFYIDDGPYLDTLEHVVDHYSRWSDGLPSILEVPVPPTETVAHTLPKPVTKPSTLEIPPPLPKRTPMPISPNTFNRLCNDVSNNNKSLPPFCKEKIPAELIKLGDVLGGGEYGEVFEGKLNLGHTVMDVAVKTLKTDEEMSEWTKKEFLQEAKVMMELEHEHIVKIIGICWSPQIYMVQELLKIGSLQDYLVEHSEDIDSNSDIRIWAHQIAKGMVYLQEKRFVHRDLAARNILLSSDRTAKISDFGLSRALGLGNDYYTASQGGRWPIKWYAPESCSHGTFSHASDVWSYGIVLWELYTFGGTPYGDMSGKDVIDMVESGERLERPKHCPEKVYSSVMKKCWEKDPDLRPKFTFLANYFADAIKTAVEEPLPMNLPAISPSSSPSGSLTSFSEEMSRSLESVPLIDLE